MKQPRCALSTLLLHSNQVNGVGITTHFILFPPFGQLAAQLFHGQVCVISSLLHLQGADKRSSVNFKCGICI